MSGELDYFSPIDNDFRIGFESEAFNKGDVNTANAVPYDILGISDDERRKKFFVNLHDLTSTFSNFNEESKYLNFKAKLYGKSVNNMNYAIENIQTTTGNIFLKY